MSSVYCVLRTFISAYANSTFFQPTQNQTMKFRADLVYSAKRFGWNSWWTNNLVYLSNLTTEVIYCYNQLLNFSKLVGLSGFNKWCFTEKRFYLLHFKLSIIDMFDFKAMNRSMSFTFIKCLNFEDRSISFSFKISD